MHPNIRPIVGWTLLLGAVVGTVALGVQPAPYVIERPGPAYDTLGEVEVEGDSVPLIDIPDETTYPTEGSLDLTTVYIDGSPQRLLNWSQLAVAWFDPSRAVYPLDSLYPAGTTEEESDAESQVDMTNSQSAATAAALTELDIPFASIVRVAGVVEGQPADGVLRSGDQIVAINGVAIDTPEALRDQIAANGIGEPMTVDITRDAIDTTVTITPVDSEQEPGTPVIGIYPGADYDFPFDVEVELQNVGGPSAGMMFALAIYDKLTPGALTGGEHIAGTGTIEGDGTVGPIGGIRQKLYAARDAGADYFLAPESNCDEVVGHVPDGIEVFATGTLQTSIDILGSLAEGGDTASLPTCDA